MHFTHCQTEELGLLTLSMYKWHGGLSRTCARTKTRDLMHLPSSYIIVCKQGKSYLMMELYVTSAVIIPALLSHFYDYVP